MTTMWRLSIALLSFLFHIIALLLVVLFCTLGSLEIDIPSPSFIFLQDKGERTRG